MISVGGRIAIKRPVFNKERDWISSLVAKNPHKLRQQIVPQNSLISSRFLQRIGFVVQIC